MMKGRATGLFFARFLKSVSIVAVGAMTGCQLLSPGTEAVTQSVTTVIESKMTARLDRSLVKETGAGVLKASFDGARPIFLGLQRVDAQTYVMDFVGQDQRVIQIYNGQLRGTLGWPVDVVSVKALGRDPFFNGFDAIHPARTVFWAVNAPTVGVGLIAEARYTLSDSASVETLFGSFKARKVIESWAIEDLGFRRVNTYWIDADGIVLRSIQQVVPSQPEMDLTLYSYGVNRQ